jgi:uncharacterized protein
MSLGNPKDTEQYMSSSPFAASGQAIEINAVMRLVYVWMFLGLLTTTFIAWYVSTSESLLELRINGGAGISIISFIVMIVVLFALHAGLTRSWLSPNLAAALYFLFTGIMGFSLSLTLFMFMSETIPGANGVPVANPYYDPGAVYAAFGTASALFGTMTLYGFTTKNDLTGWGTYLGMGLIGLIIAMFINMLIGSGPMGFLISIVGVVLFTALTAYDTQNIKRMSENQALRDDSNLMIKFSILGAIKLYLDFINLFLFLLRLFGGRD